MRPSRDIRESASRPRCKAAPAKDLFPASMKSLYHITAAKTVRVHLPCVIHSRHMLTSTGLVLLIMILASIGQRATKSGHTENSAVNGTSTSRPTTEKLQAVYIVPPHPFAEVDAFVESSASDYHLDVIRYQLPMKKGLECYLAEKKSIKAIFVGTRRTDPHGES